MVLTANLTELILQYGGVVEDPVLQAKNRWKKKKVGQVKHDAMCIIAINPQPGIQVLVQPLSGGSSQKVWQRRQRSTSRKLIDCITGKVYKEGEF